MANTVFVTISNGGPNSGYIVTDSDYGKTIFQVLGNRLQPGHAEKGHRYVGEAHRAIHTKGQELRMRCRCGGLSRRRRAAARPPEPRDGRAERGVERSASAESGEAPSGRPGCRSQAAWEFPTPSVSRWQLLMILPGRPDCRRGGGGVSDIHAAAQRVPFTNSIMVTIANEEWLHRRRCGLDTDLRSEELTTEEGMRGTEHRERPLGDDAAVLTDEGDRFLHRHDHLPLGSSSPQTKFPAVRAASALVLGHHGVGVRGDACAITLPSASLEATIRPGAWSGSSH